MLSPSQSQINKILKKKKISNNKNNSWKYQNVIPVSSTITISHLRGCQKLRSLITTLSFNKGLVKQVVTYTVSRNLSWNKAL